MKNNGLVKLSFCVYCGTKLKKIKIPKSNLKILHCKKCDYFFPDNSYIALIKGDKK